MIGPDPESAPLMRALWVCLCIGACVVIAFAALIWKVS